MKKFKIQCDVLREAVKKLQQAISDKPAVPAIENLLVQKIKGEAIFIATDLELTIYYRCFCDGEGEYSFLMPFKDLKKITALASGPLTISVADSREIIVSSETDKFNLGIPVAVDDFPSVPKVPKKNSLELNSTFIDTINAAMLTVGKDETRPVLQNICLDFKKKSLTVVSTDTTCIFTKRYTIESDFNEMLLISPKAAKAMDGFINTTIYFTQNVIAFECAQMTVVVKRHEDKYPNYKSVIPEAVYNGSCDREEIELALQKCCIVEVFEKQTVLTLSASAIDLESQSADTGKSCKTSIAGSFDGEVGNIAFNGKKLLTTLDQLPREIKKIRFSISDAQKPMLISPEGDDSMTLLIASLKFN